MSMGGMDSRGRLHGKAAIITGGEGSIGMATARTFAAEGARVCLVGLVEDELRAGASELGDAAIGKFHHAGRLRFNFQNLELPEIAGLLARFLCILRKFNLHLPNHHSILVVTETVLRKITQRDATILDDTGPNGREPLYRQCSPSNIHLFKFRILYRYSETASRPDPFPWLVCFQVCFW